PKYNVANTIGFIKGKSAVRIHRRILGSQKTTGLSFWTSAYCVSTVGLDETTVRAYIRKQEKNEQRQLELDFK
ncbi:MAG: transposase, partial [Desulfobacterales bacterium]|nr:transposase [Desulfobacterales bacterium]